MHILMLASHGDERTRSTRREVDCWVYFVVTFAVSLFSSAEGSWNNRVRGESSGSHVSLEAGLLSVEPGVVGYAGKHADSSVACYCRMPMGETGKFGSGTLRMGSEASTSAASNFESDTGVAVEKKRLTDFSIRAILSEEQDSSVVGQQGGDSKTDFIGVFGQKSFSNPTRESSSEWSGGAVMPADGMGPMRPKMAGRPVNWDPQHLKRIRNVLEGYDLRRRLPRGVIRWELRDLLDTYGSGNVYPKVKEVRLELQRERHIRQERRSRAVSEQELHDSTYPELVHHRYTDEETAVIRECARYDRKPTFAEMMGPLRRRTSKAVGKRINEVRRTLPPEELYSLMLRPAVIDREHLVVGEGQSIRDEGQSIRSEEQSIPGPEKSRQL